MAVDTPSRHWNDILTVASLLFVLTAKLVTGVIPEHCGTNRLCGYGTRCDGNGGCVCLNENHVQVKHSGTPNTIVYCFGVGVTECGEKVCGYRAHCNTVSKECECSSSNNKQKNLEDTLLWYCMDSCDPVSSICPDNTTCKETAGEETYRCYCSAGAALSSTGQCLGRVTPTLAPTAVPDTVKGTSPSPDDDSQTLIIGLAAGCGGAVLLAVIALIVVVLARRRKRQRTGGSGTNSLRRQPQPPRQSKARNSKAYESVVDPIPGPSGTDNLAGPIVIVRSEVSVNIPASRPEAYEDVDDDFNMLKLSGQGDKREADLFSNHAIPSNKENNLQEPSGNVPNQYNTSYDLNPANGNEGDLQTEKTGSGNADERTGDSATYSTVGARGGNTLPAAIAPRGDIEYDELKLPKV